MTITRRGFLTGMAGIFAAGAAPAIITTPGLLMPVRKLITPEWVGIDRAVWPTYSVWELRRAQQLALNEWEARLLDSVALRQVDEQQDHIVLEERY